MYLMINGTKHTVSGASDREHRQVSLQSRRNPLMSGLISAGMMDFCFARMMRQGMSGRYTAAPS